MKVVINVCFGGFSLSKAGTKRLAELQGRKCFFFKSAYRPDGGIDLTRYEPCAEDAGGLFWTAFDTENPNDSPHCGKDWYAITPAERDEVNLWDKLHRVDSRPGDRTDPMLIRVVEEMGEDANGACAELKVVEIPDGIEWEIDEYDGNETISEKHRSWR